MDAKLAYNGYPAPAFGQEPAPYGYPEPYQQPPQYPPQPPQYQQQPQTAQPFPEKGQNFPRGLEVAFTSWTGRHLKVTEDTHSGPLAYEADLKCRKPHMVFQRTGSANLPATVRFHNFSRTIDITINGEEMSMKGKSMWKYEFEFDSIALRGKTFTWKSSSNWVWLNMDCVDEQGTVFAHFKAHKGWTGTKTGRFEILQPAAVGGKALADELVVTGLADVYMQIMQTMAAAA